MDLSAYPFMLFGLSLAAVAAGALACRRDLAGPAALSALAALPFALTERLFYPAYWRPRFLFDLADTLGFGLEDLLFVSALAVLGVTAYPVASGRRLSPPAPGRLTIRRALLVVGATLAGFGIVLATTSLTVLPAAVLAMAAAAAALVLYRPDLLLPALLGGALTGLAYFACCLLLARLVPDVFQTTWNPAVLSGRTLAGVPLEELAYGGAAGVAGAIFYPSVTGSRFVGRAGEATTP